jgi:long-chain acyl-CoA synthetase
MSVSTIGDLFNESVKNNGSRLALGFVNEKSLSYNDVNSKVNAVMAYLETKGIKVGDKVGILSANMPNWGIAFLPPVAKSFIACVN